jgi:hypothetical protein
MLRLARWIVALMLVNAVFIVFVVAVSWDSVADRCLHYLADAGGQGLFDLKTGRFFSEQLGWLWFDGDGFSGGRNADRLVYNYGNANWLHRVGVVTRQPPYHVFIDFQESTGHFALTDYGYPLETILPIAVFDQVARTQTVTLYTTDTLTPIVSASLVGVKAPIMRDLLKLTPFSGQFSNHYHGAFSPKSAWYIFPSPTDTTQFVTVLSVKTGNHSTFPIAGMLDHIQFFWSPDERAVAIKSGEGQFVDLFVAEGEDWQSAQHYYIKTEDLKQEYDVEGWSVDSQSLYLTRRINLPTTSTHSFQWYRFRLDTRQLEPTKSIYTSFNLLHFNRQWVCDDSFGINQPALVSVTGQSEPVMLTTLPIPTESPCKYLLEAPTHDKLIIPMPGDKGQWGIMTLDPLAVTPVMLPPDTRKIIAWSDDGQLAVFFMQDIQNPPNKEVGHIGILDTKTLRRIIVREEVASEYPLAISPDLSRLTVISADRQHMLLLTTQGGLIATLPASSHVWTHAQWSLDSATFVLVEYSPIGDPTTMTIYDRDGQRIRTLQSPPDIYLWWDVSNCDPSLHPPSVNLPD